MKNLVRKTKKKHHKRSSDTRKKIRQKRQSKKLKAQTKNEQKYIIVTVGATGSGKTDMIHQLEKILNIDKILKEDYILVDNLVETDPFYRKQVNEILEHSCKTDIGSCNIDTMVEDPSDKLLENFETAYFTSRKRKGCGKEITKFKRNDLGKTCDDLNDLKFKESLRKGRNIVFETTGENKGASPAAWFLKESEWWKDAYTNIKKFDYKIIIAYSLVEISKLIDRNKSRAKSSIKKFVKQRQKDKQSGTVPRFPDIQGISKKVSRIIDNLIVLYEKCFSRYNGSNMENYCGTYALNKENTNLIIFDNSGEKGEMKLLYDHEKYQL